MYDIYRDYYFKDIMHKKSFVQSSYLITGLDFIDDQSWTNVPYQ